VKILLTHTPEKRANYYGETALAELRRLGEVRLHEGDEPLDEAHLLNAAQGCAVIVADRATPGYARLFEASPELVAFVRGAVDIRTVDVAAASRAGVLVTRASPGFVPAVCELTLGLMIELARGLSGHVAAYREGRPPEPRLGVQLAGATLGVIGYGAIGRRLAGLGRALGMEVLVSDPHVTVDEAGLRQVELEALLAASDFVVCLAVASEQTENLMGAAQFARMKRGAYFVNVSRGDLVDEAALAEALWSGRLAGAAMDVGRAPDQMPNPALARLPNVVATPHVGGLTPQAIEHQALETVAQVRAILRGEAPPGAVNAAQASRLQRLA
jgi:D-3-phosphoglycerate dehydrogenase / 2-oxoglutarate reductase